MQNLTEKVSHGGISGETGPEPTPSGVGINMDAIRAEAERLSGAARSVRVDVRATLEGWGLTVHKVTTKEGWTSYHFGDCVFHPEHKGKGIVSQEQGGAIAYGCPHHSCRGKGKYDPSMKKSWADVCRNFG